jgi:nitroreductase
MNPVSESSIVQSSEAILVQSPLIPLDVPTAILQRRTIRHFLSDPIAPELLQRLIELTIAAPTSWNLQDWSAVIVQDPLQKEALSKAAFGQKQPLEAPTTFVFVADPNAVWEQDLTPVLKQASTNGAWSDEFVARWKTDMMAFQTMLKEQGRTREYAVKDAMIAATHLVLAAESLGLSTTFMNGWVEASVKAVIGIADQPDLAIAVLVAVGYKAQAALNPGRLPSHHRIFVDQTNTPYAA